MRFCFLTFLFLKPIAKRMQTIFRHGFLFWKQKTVSKTGYQTGSNFSLSYDYLTSCLSNISKILGLVTARKGH
jgi:hypothetical protein